MNFLLNTVDPNAQLKPLDALSFGAQTVLLGMATIFSVLIIIWICLVVLKFFLHDIPARKAAEKTEQPAPAPVAPAAPVVSSNDEVVVAIAAAIAMAESEDSGLKFRVVSFRRK